MAGALTVLVFMLVVYAVAFGLHRPRLQKLGPDSDASLLDRAPMSFGGVLGALVSGTTLSTFSLETTWTRGNVLTLVAILAALTAFTTGKSSPQRGLSATRELVYFIIGVSAAALLVIELSTGACGAELPSRVAAVFAILPAALVLTSSLIAAAVFLRPIRTLRDAGRIMIAAVMVLELGIFAVYPGGIPLLEQLSTPFGGWLPLVLWLTVAVVALASGVHPRAGADLTAIGLLIVKLYFGVGFVDAACGLLMSEALWITTAFVVVFAAALGLRSLFPSCS